MGIKLLNTFMVNRLEKKYGKRFYSNNHTNDCSSCKPHYSNNNSTKTNTAPIKHINLSNLKYKKISIDVSIFIYRFVEAGALVEKMNYLCAKIIENNIIPIFVFDGAPPKEKYEAILKRTKLRIEMKEKYEELLKMANIENDDIKNKIKYYKKNSTRITKENIETTKNIIDSYKLPRIDANGEAEELCVAYVNKNVVFACLSDDTDVFAYGCTRVLRNLNMETGEIDFYKVKDICRDLNISKHDLRCLCCISGNDYNDGINNMFVNYNILKTYRINPIRPFNTINYNFNINIKSSKDYITKYGFLFSLLLNNVINENKLEEFIRIYELYNIDSSDVLKSHKFVKIKYN